MSTLPNAPTPTPPAPTAAPVALDAQQAARFEREASDLLAEALATASPGDSFAAVVKPVADLMAEHAEQIFALVNQIKLQERAHATEREAQAAELRALRAELDGVEPERLRMQEQARKLNARLYHALDALGGMYCQYTPGEFGHDFMSAGEDAQDVLTTERLLDKESNFIGMPPAREWLSTTPLAPDTAGPVAAGEAGGEVGRG